MPSPAKGARLYLRKRKGRPAVWIIRDGEHQESTRCLRRDARGAERALADYIARKHVSGATKSVRSPSQIPVADVLSLYARDIAPRHARPHETRLRLEVLSGFFTTLDQVNGQGCRAYVASRSTDAAARRELEDLRAAINYHRREGLCSEVVEVTLPSRRPPRERWLTRDEAARLLRAAWRSERRRHVARFILVGLYTGTRASAICGAATRPTVGKGWVDLERGIFYRKPAGKLETKKRRPPVPLHPRLLAHIRRWNRLRLSRAFVVEYDGEPVLTVRKGFAGAVADARLEGKVTPHVLRHTSATWLMQGGADLLEAAQLVGMTPQLLLSTYGHHHPQHLAGALRAFDHAPQARRRIAATEREQTSSNVIKLASKS